MRRFVDAMAAALHAAGQDSAGSAGSGHPGTAPALRRTRLQRLAGAEPADAPTAEPATWMEGDCGRLMEQLELAGRTALVTGSSRGIGAAIARRFAEAGSAIVLHGRDESALARIGRDIAAAGVRVMTCVADLTNADDVERMRNQVEGFGEPDILVANAGGSFARPSPIEDIDPADWRASIEANLTSAFLTVRAFLPGMKRRRAGSIITISSAAARKPYPVAPVAYGAAKAGLQLFTQDLAAQAGPFNIRANCIAPETILTERNKEQIPPDKQEMLRKMHPIARLGTPEDVAEAALYLASERSSWVTGIVLDVAGGAVLV